MAGADFNSLLALAFGAWAGVVGFIGHGIRTDLKAIGADLKQESQRLNQYIVQTETRLAKLEEKIPARSHPFIGAGD